MAPMNNNPNHNPKLVKPRGCNQISQFNGPLKEDPDQDTLRFLCSIVCAATLAAPLAGYYAFACPTFTGGIKWGMNNNILLTFLFWPVILPCVIAALAMGWFLSKQMLNRHIIYVCAGLPTLAFLSAYAYAGARGASAQCGW
jgi:hypothetical protein